MIIFKYATMLPYGVDLNYEQISKIFAGYAEWADQATNGNRSLWCLRLIGNTLTVAFKRKRDLDQFAQVFQPRATTGLASARTRHLGSKNHASTGDQSRRDTMPIYMLSFGHLDTDQIGALGAEVSVVADIATGVDRSAYEVWFHNNEVHIGFEHEYDRDAFADILDEDIDDNEVEISDLPLPAAALLPVVTVH